MKSNIVFALLLAAIISASIFGTGYAEKYYTDKSYRELIISRSSAAKEPVKVSDGSGFDISELTDIRGTVQLCTHPEKDLHFFDFSYSEIIEEMIKTISMYSIEAEYASPVDLSISKDLRLSAEGYYCLDHHKYLDPAGNVRLVDLIIDPEYFKIYYLNFYDEEEYQLSDDEIMSATEKLRHMTADLPHSDNHDLIIPEQLTLIHSKSELFHITDYLKQCGIQIKNYTSNEHYGLEDLGMSPLEDFFFASLRMYPMHISENSSAHEAGLNTTPVFLSLYEAFSLLDGYRSTSSADYSSCNGRIIQTNHLDLGHMNKNVVVIYNAATDTVEGMFCSPDSK